jgi:predicted kinase
LAAVSEDPEPGETRPDPFLVLVTGLQGTGKSMVAATVGPVLTAPVLGHDWSTSALRPFAGVQDAIQAMGPSGQQVVGWSILCALGTAQLRHGRSVVLDGVARTAQRARCLEIARQERARLLVILTTCSDPEVHRQRVETRRRQIPNWPELPWCHVQRTIDTWTPPGAPDLVVEATDPWRGNESMINDFLRDRRFRQ